MPNKTRILIFGAGVIGSVYARKFIESGFDVSILARGDRLRELQKNGLRYMEKGKEKAIAAKAIENLDDDDIYSFVFVAVRYDQMHDALLALKNNKSENILTLANTASYEKWAEIVGGKLIPGFPAAGGDIKDGVLNASFSSLGGMGTVFGEINGQTTNRLKELEGIFNKAGLPCTIEKNILAYHLTHAAVVSPMRHFYTEDGMVGIKTASSSATLRKLAKELKENISKLKANKIPIVPPFMSVAGKLPSWAIVLVFKAAILFPFGKDTLFGNHAQRAKDETLQLSQFFSSI